MLWLAGGFSWLLPTDESLQDLGHAVSVAQQMLVGTDSKAHPRQGWKDWRKKHDTNSMNKSSQKTIHPEK